MQVTMTIHAENESDVIAAFEHAISMIRQGYTQIYQCNYTLGMEDPV